MEKFIKSENIPKVELKNGLSRQILGYNQKLMTVKVSFKKDVVAEKHKHPHEQISYVLKGKFKVTNGNQVQILQKGDGFIVPSNTTHGVICLEEGEILDNFSPIQEDFLTNK